MIAHGWKPICSIFDNLKVDTKRSSSGPKLKTAFKFCWWESSMPIDLFKGKYDLFNLKKSVDRSILQAFVQSMIGTGLLPYVRPVVEKHSLFWP
jgi:hypothetical protein